jgi:hypothetical protein
MTTILPGETGPALSLAASTTALTDLSQFG